MPSSASRAATLSPGTPSPLRDRGRLVSALHDVHRERDHRRDVAQVGRDHERVPFLREVAELRDVLLGDAELHRLVAPRYLDRLRDETNAIGGRLRDRANGLGLTFGLV